MTDKKTLPSTTLLGVGQTKADDSLPKTDLQIRKSRGGVEEIRQTIANCTAMGDHSPAMQLMILHASQLTKQAAIDAMKRSTEMKPGDNLHLETPEKPQIATADQKEIEDYSSSTQAKLQEVMSLAAEHLDHCYTDLKQSIREAVTAVKNDDLQLGSIYLERTLINAATILRAFNKVNARENPTYSTLQSEAHKSTLQEALKDLFALEIEKATSTLETACERLSLKEKMVGMIDMFFTPEPLRTRH